MDRATGHPTPLRLLLADDRSRTRQALRALLSTLTALEIVGEAADGLETVAAVERVRPDVVLVDVQMPRLDGVAATRQIKERWPGVRVVAHSLAVERRAEALAAGADAFVAKGSPVSDLLDAVTAA